MRTGATRLLVLSDTRLASQLGVEGTPTILVARPGPFSAPLRVVGELVPKRIGSVIASAAALERAVPTAFTILGTWRVDALALTQWNPVRSPQSDSATRATQQANSRTMAAVRAGTLRVETTFDASFPFAHRLWQSITVSYQESGAGALPTYTDRLHVMRDDANGGTYHGARVVYGDAD